MSERQRGFYWGLACDRDEPEVGRWNGVVWWLDGGPFDDASFAVMSGRLSLPEERSGCVHAAEFRRGDQCKRCGTLGLGGKP